MLTENVFVDPIDLHMSSDHLAMHEGELSAAHAAADSVMAQAQAAWVGASSAAMRSRLLRCHEETESLISDLAAQGAHIRCAAYAYALTDDDAAFAVGRWLSCR